MLCTAETKSKTNSSQTLKMSGNNRVKSEITSDYAKIRQTKLIHPAQVPRVLRNDRRTLQCCIAQDLLQDAVPAAADFLTQRI